MLYLLPGAQGTVFQGLGSLILALSPVQSAQVLERCGDGGTIHLGCLVPAAVLSVGCVLLVAVLVLFPLLRHLPDRLVVACNTHNTPVSHCTTDPTHPVAKCPPSYYANFFTTVQTKSRIQQLAKHLRSRVQPSYLIW